MRDSLKKLIDESIIFQYQLPNKEINIDKSIFSTENDQCYKSYSNDSLSEIIYNSIIEYSFNEFDIVNKDYENLLARALVSKLKYNNKATEIQKISYGFFGETLLYCILHRIFNTTPVIARGYFYNPLDNSETKGYDSYHLIQNNNTTELWFGEVKFRQTHSSGIREAIENLEKTISDQYLGNNFIALGNHKNNFNIAGTVIETIIENWENDAATIKISEEINKYNLKLIYPILILYDKHSNGYDTSIQNAINYIQNNFSTKSFNLSIPYSIYFIWLPVDKVRDIKTTVIKWIESKKQLIS